MRQFRKVYLTVGLTVSLVTPALQAAYVDFEGQPVGTSYGGFHGNKFGQVVLNQDFIAMSVEKFFLGDFTGFNEAVIGGRFDDDFPTTPLDLNNISVRFNLNSVGFAVNKVTLEYKEFGGSDNFAVNDQTIYELSTLTQIPFNVAPGVTATVLNNVITLNGAINSFRIGGQELAIDNVNAVPEPTTCLLLLAGAGLLARARKPRSHEAKKRM